MKKLLVFFPIVIGILFLGILFPKNNESSNIIEEVDKKLRIYYIRHAEGGHNVKREWGIFPKSEWPSYVGNREAFTP